METLSGIVEGGAGAGLGGGWAVLGDPPSSSVSAAVAAKARLDPDSDVLDLAGAGDLRGALTLLVRRYGSTVRRYCRDQLGDHALADDVHQQIFLQAYRDLPDFAHKSMLRSWLLGVARHRVLDAAKARRRAEAHLVCADVSDDEDADLDVADPTPPPDERLDRARLGHVAVRCLRGLGGRARDVLVLRYQRDLEFAELAAIFGGRPDTLRARAARALPVLRARVEACVGVRS